MEIHQLITPDRVKCLTGIASKKRAIESLSHLLSSGVMGVDPNDIFHKLIERERLGSTGLGHGVALPHGRIVLQAENFSSTSSSPLVLGSFIKLDKGVDFDSLDKEPADLLFALLVPEHCTDEHLQILAKLAGMFSDTEFCQQLRQCVSDDELYAQLSGWSHAHQVAS